MKFSIFLVVCQLLVLIAALPLVVPSGTATRTLATPDPTSGSVVVKARSNCFPYCFREKGPQPTQPSLHRLYPGPAPEPKPEPATVPELRLPKHHDKPLPKPKHHVKMEVANHDDPTLGASKAAAQAKPTDGKPCTYCAPFEWRNRHADGFPKKIQPPSEVKAEAKVETFVPVVVNW